MSRCAICGDKLNRARGARGARCRTCYAYRRRHGHDRPLELIVRLTERDIERELAARLTEHMVMW
jgi:uroporphyrinogen-III synthase